MRFFYLATENEREFGLTKYFNIIDENFSTDCQKNKRKNPMSLLTLQIFYTSKLFKKKLVNLKYKKTLEKLERFVFSQVYSLKTLFIRDVFQF